MSLMGFDFDGDGKLSQTDLATGLVLDGHRQQEQTAGRKKPETKPVENLSPRLVSYEKYGPEEKPKQGKLPWYKRFWKWMQS